MDGRLMRRAPKRRTEKRAGSTEVVGRGLDFERWRGLCASSGLSTSHTSPVPSNLYSNNFVM